MILPPGSQISIYFLWPGEEAQDDPREMLFLMMIPLSNITFISYWKHAEA